MVARTNERFRASPTSMGVYMKGAIEAVLGRKIGGARVIPLVLKILVFFVIFLLISNFATNYINLTLNRGQQIELLNQLLVKDLKDLYVFANGQWDIVQLSSDIEGAADGMAGKAIAELKRSKAISFGVLEDGEIFFQASKTVQMPRFTDETALAGMVESRAEGIPEGSVRFTHSGADYFGVYKYNAKWSMYVVRAEELNEFYAESRRNFINISMAIVAITLICAIVGGFLIAYILRFVRAITSAIMKMQEQQNLDLIDLEGAPNDDVTYLGVAFNALSSEIRNLLDIFRKFVTKDVVSKAYKERQIRLEGRQEELTILFSDIKSFTYITETLGTDIIKLLNLHYERAILHIHEQDGIIGSIIGDALLAVFGTTPNDTNKSVLAVRAGYGIQKVAAELREQMYRKREEINQQRGGLTDTEEAVYKAVLLEVGVGIDGGAVFYGNIGSSRRMTNTVIGDNVNASSRLEGLTRVYKIPIICSDFVMKEVVDNTDDYRLVEIDQVQVKGKTIAKKVYWPIPAETIDDDFSKDLEAFSKGLEYYYEGQWSRASSWFEKCTLPLAGEFKSRTASGKRPTNWNGVWTMTTK